VDQLYAAIGLVVLAAIVCLIAINQVQKGRHKRARTSRAPLQPEMSEAYSEWRRRTFAGAWREEDPSAIRPGYVVHVVMDVGTRDPRTSAPNAISILAGHKGRAEYHSTAGASVEGLGDDPRVARAAGQIVQIAPGLCKQDDRTGRRDLPAPGWVRFTVRGLYGMWLLQERLGELQEPDHPLGELYGHFTRIRQVAEQQIDQGKASLEPATAAQPNESP
jgi:hypothetical protein